MIYVSFKKDNYIVMHQKNVTTGLLEASPFVMNTSRSVQVGNPVNFLDTNVSAFDAENGDFGCAGGGDDWFINSNGTISQKYTPELVLGFKTAGMYTFIHFNSFHLSILFVPKDTKSNAY